MSEVIENNKAVKRFGLTASQWRIAIPVTLGLIIVLAWPKPVPFVNPKIIAQPFIWPTGCQQKTYSKGDPITAACLKYHIADGPKWGWPRGSKWPDYYRIGDDAVWVICNVYTSRCRVFDAVRDVYVRGN